MNRNYYEYRQILSTRACVDSFFVFLSYYLMLQMKECGAKIDIVRQEYWTKCVCKCMGEK